MEDSWKVEEDDTTGNLSASIIADTEVEVYRIDRLFMFQLFRSNPGLFERFYKIVALMLAERCINLPYKREVDKLRGLSVSNVVQFVSGFIYNEVAENSRNLSRHLRSRRKQRKKRQRGTTNFKRDLSCPPQSLSSPSLPVCIVKERRIGTTAHYSSVRESFIFLDFF